MGEHSDTHAHEHVLAERNQLRAENQILKATLDRERRKRGCLYPFDPAEVVEPDMGDW